ncbi:MAG TPA: DNA-binding domain-containing protein [Candidatus Acidoferrum sp.]
MARAVMQPLTPSENMSKQAPTGGPMSQYAGKFIKPNDRLSSFERLEIYNRQYWWRLMASMAEDFPGLQAILGNQRFEALCKAYITARPSRSFTLRNLGRELHSWLQRNPKWAGTRQAMALDMVKLEWADIDAFDGAAEEPLRPADIAKSASGNLRLRLQPYVHLLKFRYPVDELVLEIKKFNDDTEFLSNTFRERGKRKHVAAVATLKPQTIFLAVHRVDDSVYFRRLEAPQYDLLLAIQKGRTLAQAVSDTFAKRSNHSQADPAEVTHWFHNWSKLGWFCALQPKSIKKSKKR